MRVGKLRFKWLTWDCSESPPCYNRGSSWSTQYTWLCHLGSHKQHHCPGDQGMRSSSRSSSRSSQLLLDMHKHPFSVLSKTQRVRFYFPGLFSKLLVSEMTLLFRSIQTTYYSTNLRPGSRLARQC